MIPLIEVCRASYDMHVFRFGSIFVEGVDIFSSLFRFVHVLLPHNY